MVSCRAVSTPIALALLALAGACVQSTAETPSSLRPVAVHPRVVMDGMAALTARAEGRVAVHEVQFHAPVVRGADTIVDEEPLLFRYSSASGDPFGNVVGGERHWLLTDDGSLTFAFGELEAEHADALALATQLDVDTLVGHTAFVRGTVTVDVEADGAAHGFSVDGDVDDGDEAADSDPEGVESDSDPDGQPADSDPDGQPAQPVPVPGSDGSDGDSDPDGQPADAPADTDAQADSDPDGQPADSDPDGQPADSDPDGQPAWGDDGRTAANAKASTTGGSLRKPKLERRTTKVVPFTLVVTGGFDRRVDFHDADLAELGGAVLPINLDVDLSQLFSQERLAELLSVGAAASAEAGVVLEVAASSSAVGVSLGSSVKHQATAAPGARGLRVVGDAR